MFKKVIYIAAIVLFPLLGIGQELNCSVDIQSPQIQDASAQLLFKNLRDAIYNFMNTTKWTNDNFTNQEKIECSLFFNMTVENAPNDFNATLQIQAKRPIFKTNIFSVMLNFQDNNIHILYQLNQQMIFNINTYSDNLTALLSYYAYMIIGNDYDSFALNGGTPYYMKAQTILTNAQASGEKGWNPQDGDQTRYVLLTNILDEGYFGPLRKAMYEYHRLGLDVMSTAPEKGRAQVMAALTDVQEVYNEKPGNYNIMLFFNAKATELANIFGDATNEEKAQALAILNAIDPTDADKYVKLKSTE